MQVITDISFADILKNENLDKTKLQALVVKRLRQKSLHLATAESCTGGLISKKITEVSGSSEVFDCGVCSYANFIKHRVLGVKNETLEKHGAVSAECALEMAKGVALLSNADIGISTTGIAGPGGGTQEKPVGLVYIGIYTKHKSYEIKTLLNESGNNDREKVRELASCIALYIILIESVNFM